MSSAAALQTLIDAGYDILSIKYYAAAGVTLLFYDYFLTLPDEIRYAWKGRKPWIFYIFLVNRYVPILYETWIVVVVWWPGFTYEMCNNTAWIEIAIFVFLTLLAQIFLTMRIYALTMKNKMIVAFFSGVTIPQLALGIYLTYLGATNPAVVLPPIPLDAFRLCVFARHRPIEIGYTSISLFFDSAAFFVIFSSGLRTGLSSSSVSSSRPSLVHTIVHDATIYFFVIFTSHLIFLSTLIFERPTLQLLPAVGNDVFLPIMIARLMLSLKKAATVEDGWSFSEMTTVHRPNEMQFAQEETGDHTRHWVDESQARSRIRMPRRGESDQVTTDTYEEIGLETTKSLDEPSVSGTA